MAVIHQPYLFRWDHVDAQSDLERLRLVLGALDDEEFVGFLEELRGRGRDDYPIRPTWNALFAGMVFQHPSAQALLRELRRNAELRQVCGFDPHRGAAAAPTEDAFGRFLKLVVTHRERLLPLFHRLLTQLGEVLDDLGRYLAGDSKALSSFGKPVKDAERKAHADGRRDTDADWGKKTYRGHREDGTLWQKVTSWFGYKLHLIVDSVHELPLAFRVTTASKNDSPEILPLLDDLAAHHPELVARCEELALDKGYDSAENNREPYDQRAIKPVIAKRKTWKDGEKTRPLYPERADAFVYDEDGQLFCVCPATGEQREMFFSGFEKDRAALKYRCPAAAYDFACKGRAQCEERTLVGAFGRIVRVPLETDRRIFTPIARHTDKWKKAYARRTAVERVNSRIDNVLGFECHFIRGLAKMETRVTLGLIVMLAMALGRVRADQRDQLRSLTAPVKRAA